ncbi:DJ-1/PfpI family protein [Paenibacillus sp. 481]|uniref:DJ-1/PfpI family protein n=1 Tax=Paenibacillus sp. 481 TaxID=2835869 RepID=UPI001E5498EC|nr:DJ-1/PfpI family protein [Paenibacillus sp. 481]UHA72197.1 DJ-1/PfpI family protein [Paenibacillus sp. 481]
MKVALIIWDEFTDLDLFLPWDLLNRVRLYGGRSDWEVNILGTKKEHVSDAGMVISTSGMLEEASRADAVLFTSGKKVPELINDPSFLSRITLNPDQQFIGAMCSGTLMLAALGLLENREATTYPTRREMLQAYGVTVVDRPFVIQDRIATAAGCLAAIDLSTWVIRSLAGEDMVSTVMQTVAPNGLQQAL